jgi:preprotein translocase subunit SecD
MRIREELRLGKTAKAALAGYAKAFLTILDSNLTTLLAGVILFQFGTGPVKGFAVTLSVGILTTLFTAVFVTRLIYDYFMARRPIKRLSV